MGEGWGRRQVDRSAATLRKAPPPPYPPPIKRGREFEAATSSANFVEVDIAAGDDADDRALARLAGQRRGERQGAGAFGDDPRFFGHQAHGAARLVEGDDDRAVDDRAHPLPHAREDALAAGAVDEGRLPLREALRRPPSRSDSAEGAAVSGSAPRP